jgi:hypothetical protein
MPSPVVVKVVSVPPTASMKRTVAPSVAGSPRRVRVTVAS